MSDRPSLMTRMSAALKGEVAAQTAEAYRRAGVAVYAELDRAEQLRKQLTEDGADLWSAPPASTDQLLATWNAFCLQTIAEQLIDADYAADPSTVGYLPKVTAEQVWRLFSQVEPWLSRARQAASNPRHDLAQEVFLPADLPAWVEAEPCPRAHLIAMSRAGRAIRDRAEVAVGVFTSAKVPDGRQADVDRVRQLAADAATASEYAENLLQADAGQQLHEQIEARLHHALETWFDLGQLVAKPSLIAGYRQQRQPAAYPANPRPGAFDPWCLTDAATRATWQADPKARKAIESLWRYDPDRAQTLAMHHAIEQGLQAGDIALATDSSGRQFGHYYCCPWSSIYVARRQVIVNGVRLRAGQQFALDVSAEEIAEGGPFVRRMIVGPFHTTSEIDYCDPAGGGHHD